MWSALPAGEDKKEHDKEEHGRKGKHSMDRHDSEVKEKHGREEHEREQEEEHEKRKRDGLERELVETDSMAWLPELDIARSSKSVFDRQQTSTEDLQQLSDMLHRLSSNMQQRGAAMLAAIKPGKGWWAAGHAGSWVLDDLMGWVGGSWLLGWSQVDWVGESWAG